eukprot:2996938-Pyramimonas_sp.AAC.1
MDPRSGSTRGWRSRLSGSRVAALRRLWCLGRCIVLLVSLNQLGVVRSAASGIAGCQPVEPMTRLKNPSSRGLGFKSSSSL